MALVKRHPIITFFVLTYVIAWVTLPFGTWGVRAAGRRPHRDPYKPGSCGAKGARLADDPLAR